LPRYECDRCGACCRHLIIEIEHLDLVREPRLWPVATLLDGNGRITYESDWDKQYGLACGRTRPCQMLGPDNLCGVYPTRPNVCVAMEPGNDQCRMAHESAGLTPLTPLSE
jgi:Fe-S-cluster containining protein